MYKRPSKDEYFLEIANVVAKRSTCLRIHVGAVIVKEGRILSTGYNGSPAGFDHCLDVGCIREAKHIAHGTMHEVCQAVHAEQNAIIQAAIHGVSIEGSTLYCTHQPCILCTKMLINAKIKRIVYERGYPDDRSLEFLDKAGVEVHRIPVDDDNVIKVQPMNIG